MIERINITWHDDNHAHVQDPSNGREFDITIRPKKRMFSPSGHVIKPRLYVGGKLVDETEKEIGHRSAIAWAKEHFGSTLEKVLNRKIKMRFSSKAGCSCGCSPGFIIEDGGESIPFNIWMDVK